jgi:hypothetical protein
MKYSILASLVGGLFFSACQQEPSAPNNDPTLPLAAHGGSSSSSSVNTAWTFMSQTWSKGANHFTIAVSDSDGTDKTDVYIASGGTSTEQTRFPTWGPGGTSVSFVIGPPPTSTWYLGTPYGNYSIKAVDVAISNGSVRSSNTRTICSYSTSDSIKIVEQSWCRTSGINKIAFIALTPTDGGIYTVSSSGGTPTKIYSLPRSQGQINCGALEGNAMGWSPDGSKITFAERDSASDGTITYGIKIINADGSGTPTVLDQGTGRAISGVQWSHAGQNNQNKLSYMRTTVTNPAVTDWDLYTIDISSGTPTFLHSSGLCAFWSPNNSELVYADHSSSPYIMKKVDVASGSTTTLSISTGYIANYGDWK